MERLVKPCSFCGKPSDGIHREVIGWERRERGHGLNHLMMRRETGRVLCADCAYDVRHGQEPGTPKLFTP